MDFSTFVLLAKAAVVLVNAGILALLGFVLVRAWEARPDILGAPGAVTGSEALERRRAAVAEAWAAIVAQSKRGADGARLAVIDADRLVDALLKDAGYEGEGALERMRQLPADRLASVGGLLSAHRLRNRLVHEVEFKPREADLDAALEQFRTFLTEVRYL